ncbi:MAG: DEAD/DEAH box helicase [Canibacter sp.]
MSRKRRSGFKAPKHYEPRRGGSAKGKGAGRGRSMRADDAPGRKSGNTSGVRAGAKTGARANTRTPRVQRETKPAARFQPDMKHFEKLEATVADSAAGKGLTFADLGLGPRLCAQLAELGASEPFAIQAVTVPDILAGLDVLGRATTGSGKTIAFGAAIVERLATMKHEGRFASDPKPVKQERLQRGKRTTHRSGGRVRSPKAVILAPTRELALQIDRTVQPLARTVGLFTTQLVGGVPIQRQQHALSRGVDIVIGTPGRIEDLIQRGELELRDVEIAVLDEADHMSELGFIEPVQRILRLTKTGSQKLMFSATLDGEVALVAHEFMRSPTVHEIAGVREGKIVHHVMIVMREDKDEVLVQLAKPHTIMFTRTRAYAERLAELLQRAGIDAVELHGDLSQHRREKNLQRFTRGKADVLVATDVAARGIHVDNIAVVVQADPPDNHKSYLHRSGRTGRAGHSGTVVTVIARTRQKKTRAMLEDAGITPATFADFVPGDSLPYR